MGHHVREGAARAEAGDGAALSAVVGSPGPVEHSPAHQRRAQVARRRYRRGRRWRAGGAGERRRWRHHQREQATGRPLGGGDGGLAVGQAVEQLPHVARHVKDCPEQQYVAPAIVHLEFELLLHLLLRHAVQAATALARAAGGGGHGIVVVIGAVWSSEVRAQAFDIELWADAPRRGDIEPHNGKVPIQSERDG